MKKSYKERKSFSSKRVYAWTHSKQLPEQKRLLQHVLQTHLTCLHGKRDEQHDEGTSNRMNVSFLPRQDGGKDKSMIIPVWVRPEGDLCDRLNLHGQETRLLLTTMQEKNALIQRKRIVGLEVLDYHKEHVIKLPMAFTCEVVPANKSQIPKPEWSKSSNISSWLQINACHINWP